MIQINDACPGGADDAASFGQVEDHLMSINEGTVDRALRIILGLVLIAMVFVGPKIVWGWVGVVPLLTGLVGFCPLYRVVGINTCPRR